MTSSILSFYRAASPLPFDNDPSVPHSACDCQGNCAEHPLMSSWMTLSWADIDEQAQFLALKAETSTDRQKRLIEAAGEKLERAAIKASSEREMYARHVKDRASMGQKKGQGLKKIQQPCKWVVGQYAGDECWAFEYTDPKTGVRERPHTCERLHPGEAGWCAEWLVRPRFQPAGSVSRFEGLKVKTKTKKCF